MKLHERVRHEFKAMVLTTLYFAVWFGVLVGLKQLILDDYHIAFRGWSLALFGALVVAKVVLVMEHVPLGPWTRHHPAMLEVIVRTILYGVLVLVVLLIEKAFESRHDHGGFAPALAQVFQHEDMPHVWANTICVACALLVFNALSVVRGHLGEGQLVRLFLAPRPEPVK